jgi:quercetin dioxygenase-like cupin family protein
MKRHLVATAIIIAAVSAVLAQQHPQHGASDALPTGFETKPVIKSTKTADGDAIQFPTGGTPEIVSVIGTLQPGGRTARHQHPVPVYVYVLEGELQVQTDGKEPRQYKSGEAFLESVNTWHQASNKGSTPTRILVVFVGQEGMPSTVNATTQ